MSETLKPELCPSFLGGNSCFFATRHLVHDTEDDGVDEADPRHPHQAQQEQISIAVQLEVGGFGVQDGAHELAFLCAEACGNTGAQS